MGHRHIMHADNNFSKNSSIAISHSELRSKWTFEKFHPIVRLGAKDQHAEPVRNCCIYLNT